MQRRRRGLLKALGIGGAAANLPTAWTKPVVESVLLPAHAQTTDSGPRPITRVTFTYTDTVADIGQPLPTGVSISDPVTISIAFAASAIANQTFTANDVLSFVWRVGSLTVTINDTGAGWDVTTGDFQTDGAGTIIQVLTDWQDTSPSATLSNADTLYYWYLYGVNGVLLSLTANWEIGLVNVANMLSPSNWSVSAS